MNHINDRIKTKCSACSACMNICPQSAITIEPDIYGFIYPCIDQKKCIDCGLCLKICNYQKSQKRHSLKETYAAATIDTEPLQSASGGIFASFAKHVLEANGVVYGCAMVKESDKLIPKHIRVDKPENLILMQGSKYVQSEMDNTYLYVQEDLKRDKTVLFSGTPCQVDGLRGFLRKDYPNLFTVDIICHGVPSVQMFHDYLEFEGKKRKGKVISYQFRDKSDGWRLHGKMTVKHDNGRTEDVLFEPEQSSFYQMFLNSYTYRENCYSCPYACDNRPGDITIGDYWCIDSVHPEMLVQNGGAFDERKGISCMIVNNRHGRDLLSEYGSGIERLESSFENAAKYNGQLSHPSVLKPEREVVLKKYSERYYVLDQWYRRRLMPIKVKRKIRALVPRKIKRVLKQFW